MTLAAELPRPTWRVGVFGGAFDPPHVAHLALAQAAVSQLQLDSLRIMPTGDAWHKSRSLSAASHRLAMAQLAFAEMAQVQVDPREIQRSGPTYTIDTLIELQAEWPDAVLHLIIGADQARALAGWHRWRELLQIAIICVAGRDATVRTGESFHAQPAPEGLLDCLPEAVRAQGRFLPLQLAPMAVSATQIRDRVASGLGIADLVTPAVARYIAQNHLYLPL